MSLPNIVTPPQDFAALLTSLNYAPEQTGIAPYATKLAEGLHLQGIDIQVLAGYPHYPQWEAHSGYTGMTMEQHVNGVSIRRLRHRIPSVPKFLPRIHMELSYGLRILLTKWHASDVALTISPALFASGMTVLKARSTGTPVGIWVQDLYSRGLEETTGSSLLVSRAVKFIEGKILRSATGVTVIHERFRQYVVDELGVSADKVHVIRNWSHIEVPEKIDRESVRESLGWKVDEIIALHAGNMGVKQDLGNIIEAARVAFSSGSKVRFVLLGDGNQRPALEASAEGVGNLSFLAPLSDANFVPALQAADVLLVNELPGVKEMSVPSKLTSYFATGQPIIAATEPDSATADEIRASGSGLHVQSGKPSELLAAIEELASNPDLATKCSVSGTIYAQTILSEKRAIDEFAIWLSSLKNSVN
ncbi:glycosyltransferase family 4 protein [Paeniglutamicibacter psychrophenolicus]|uniref:glycosyltransferase family 4 protein n=1 Tax=Paeniglutamicibacter psychrophenolicus TaxID=257454 RepID=UPI002782F76C|nr:glycosyltransferase family 4 protein [Paeniglutamicibacter psychrophenolicus]MDQ0094668.1 glycosyltransferase involved in cell wall biosynthesis [Paeniglutamicibacter psychrophenolicus]